MQPYLEIAELDQSAQVLLDGPHGDAQLTSEARGTGPRITLRLGLLKKQHEARQWPFKQQKISDV
jgi:hypothetical protein